MSSNWPGPMGSLSTPPGGGGWQRGAAIVLVVAGVAYVLYRLLF